MYQVMVVDDEREVLDTLEAYIEEADLGFSVVAKALSGEEALFYLDIASPDVLITDIKMPVIDGLSLLRSAKARGWDGYAVLVSGYDEFEYAQQAIRLNVRDYLLKPIFPDSVVELLQSIRESHEKERGAGGPATATASRSGSVSTPGSGPAPGAAIRLPTPLSSEHGTASWAGALGGPAPTSIPDFVVRAQEYILESYCRPLSLPEVARHVGVSPTYLSAQFSQWCGRSFIEYLTDIRLQRAKELLVQTSLPVQCIVEMVGYNDPCYFSRVFRKATGQSPGQYRKTFLKITRRRKDEPWSPLGRPGTSG